MPSRAALPLRFFLLTAFLVGLAAWAGGGVVTDHTEDFTTTLFRDGGLTTATWDTVAAELSMDPFGGPTYVGGYDAAGPVFHAALAGDVAYLAAYNEGLVAVDITDLTAPTFLGRVNTPGFARQVDVEGDYAYVADETNGMAVVDISDPGTPSVVYSLNMPGTCYGATVQGDYAYICNGTSGFYIFDVSMPTVPTFAGSYNTPGEAHKAVIAGDLAYVADGPYGLTIIDVSTPSAPAAVASLLWYTGYAVDVALSGDVAFLADTSGVYVLDVSAPTLPTSVTTFANGEAVHGLDIDGDFAYLALEGGLLAVYDVSDPVNPAHLYDISTTDEAQAVVVAGEHAFVSDEFAGLSIFQVCDWGPASPAGSYPVANSSYAVAVTGHHAFLGSDLEGLLVLDISDRWNPTLVGNYAASEFAREIDVSGDYAYVADADAGFYALDIKDPTTPGFVGGVDPGGYARCLAASGSHVYMGSDANLEVIDIANIVAPSVVASYPTADLVYDVAVDGNLAFLAERTTGLEVLDISNPASPHQVAVYSTSPYMALGVAVAGDLAYVAVSNGGIRVLDISTPSAPVEIGSWGVGIYNLNCQRIEVRGDLALVSNSSSIQTGLRILDISDPTNPVSIGTSVAMIPSGGSLVVDGDFAYVASVQDGLRIYSVFSRTFDHTRNIGVSLPVNDVDANVIRARFHPGTTYTGPVTLELSNDDGGTWRAFPMDWSWEFFETTGSELRWRARLQLPTPQAPSACTSVGVEWIYDAPVIASVTDVPNDQGRQVSLTWVRSGYDNVYVETTPAVTEYSVYRRIDGVPAKPGPGDEPETYPPGDWHYVTTVPADLEEDYAVVVPTLGDSTVAEGDWYSTFFVRARTATPGVYYDSPPDSGYSLDNLAPSPPEGLAFNAGTLTWNDPADADFDYFTVYGSDLETWDETAVLIGATSGTSADVNAYPYAYYHVTATDFAGNEGDAATLWNPVSVPDGGFTPKAYALRQSWPNPFGSATTISFDLPSDSEVRLEVFDVRGRLVNTLIRREMVAGRYRIPWSGVDDSGRALARGTYFYRLVAGEFVQSRKVVLVR